MMWNTDRNVKLKANKRCTYKKGLGLGKTKTIIDPVLVVFYSSVAVRVIGKNRNIIIPSYAPSQLHLNRMRTSESITNIYENHYNNIYQLKLLTKIAEKHCQATYNEVWARNFPKLVVCGVCACVSRRMCVFVHMHVHLCVSRGWMLEQEYVVFWYSLLAILKLL